MKMSVAPVRQSIRIITSTGVVFVDGLRLAHLAAHITPGLELLNGTPVWTITHVPTGFRLGSDLGFDSESDAVAFVRALDALPINWGNAHVLRKDESIRRAFNAIATLCKGIELVPEDEVPA